MIYHDAIVVGGWGLAGFRAAIELNRHNVRVAIFQRYTPFARIPLLHKAGLMPRWEITRAVFMIPGKNTPSIR